ncbi:Protein of unknown function [Gryllus bimaculatus]|nr:Protein of unknown function [Gryllus bimaculatus]
MWRHVVTSFHDEFLGISGRCCVNSRSTEGPSLPGAEDKVSRASLEMELLEVTDYADHVLGFEKARTAGHRDSPAFRRMSLLLGPLGNDRY